MRNIDKPCFKLRGPKAEARHNLWRRLPTAANAMISGEDMLLLQYAYFGNDMYRDIFKRMSTVYGETISDPPLRNAILAQAYTCLVDESTTFCFKFEAYRSLACRGLIRKLYTPSTISFSDVLTSFLLWSTGTIQSSLHLRGCLSLSNFLLDSSADTTPTDLVKDTFGLIYDVLHWHLNWDFRVRGELLQLWRRTFGTNSWFRQTHKHWRGNSTLANEKPIRDQTGNIIVTAQDTVALVAGVFKSLIPLFSLVLTIANAEAKGIEDFERDSLLTNTVHSVLSDLDDPEFNNIFEQFGGFLPIRYINI